MVIVEEITRHPGRNVIIHCPACDGRNVSAQTYDQKATDKWLDLVTVWVSRSTWVICTNCRAKLYSKLNCIELQGKSPEEISDQISLQVSFVRKFLAILALCLAVFPYLGVVMAMIGVIANWKSRGWPKVLSYAGLCLTGAAHVVLGVLIWRGY